MSGQQNPDLAPVLGAPQGHHASSALTLPPGTAHTAKKQWKSDWPYLQGWAGEMKHFGVSKLSKHLGCSTWPESRKRRGAGVVLPHHGGNRLPLKKRFMQHLGGPGAMSPSAPGRTGLVSSWERWNWRVESAFVFFCLFVFVLTPHQLRPVCPSVRCSLAGAPAPGARGFVLSFW